jgi:hypothetical protein
MISEPLILVIAYLSSSIISAIFLIAICFLLSSVK